MLACPTMMHCSGHHHGDLADSSLNIIFTLLKCCSCTIENKPSESKAKVFNYIKLCSLLSACFFNFIVHFSLNRLPEWYQLAKFHCETLHIPCSLLCYCCFFLQKTSVFHCDVFLIARQKCSLSAVLNVFNNIF